MYVYAYCIHASELVILEDYAAGARDEAAGHPGHHHHQRCRGHQYGVQGWFLRPMVLLGGIKFHDPSISFSLSIYLFINLSFYIYLSLSHTISEVLKFWIAHPNLPMLQ